MTNIPSAFDARKRWRALPAAAKIYYANDAVLASPIPLALSINLCPRYQRKRFVWLRERLVRHLKHHLKRDDVALLVVHDISSKGLWHLHGILAAHDASEEPLIRRACHDTAGNWDHRRGRHRQVHIQPLRDHGWGGYLSRHTSVRTVWSMTNELRIAAKALHSAQRQKTKNAAHQHHQHPLQQTVARQALLHHEPSSGQEGHL
jgi:hypothetical protein